ncbi:MAG: hypothetical protein JJU06_13115 [Ectothiorhodospiraceae bacterium]|nr:hypothetical protein [Ectothiorhodospiraceae bacterium]MCH8504082.1 hypothetical protein [Ectothiorhodospiraceae bacterium]
MTFQRLPYITNPEALLADVRRRCTEYLERWQVTPADAGNAYRVTVEHGAVLFHEGPEPLYLTATADAAVRLLAAADAWVKCPARCEAADALRAAMDQLHLDFTEGQGQKAYGGKKGGAASRLPDPLVLVTEAEALRDAGVKPHKLAEKQAQKYHVDESAVRKRWRQSGRDPRIAGRS